MIGHKAGITTDMKLAIVFLAIIVTLSFGACSTDQAAPKVVGFTPCCATGQPEKTVILKGSFEPGGDVVRLTPH
jgi:hypothetical protein